MATPITKQTANDAMRTVDAATQKALADIGLEAVRFDADLCPAEGWHRVNIKVRSR